jgi:hypothetical protein
MFTCSSSSWLSRLPGGNLAAACGAAIFLAAGALAQFDSPSSVKVNLPPDSPLSLISADFGESRGTPRGGALVLDLRMHLSLRNSSQSHVRGVTLLVTAQEVTPGGKASVAVPSLNVAPGEVFPVRIDLRLLRPLQLPPGALVEIGLDGVLFDNFGFYGPDRLNSRRSMVAWEMEAQRDRQHFKSILRAMGPEGLRQSVLQSLARDSERPRLNVQVARSGRAAGSVGTQRLAQFAFLKLPGAPVEPLEGSAQIAGSEARAPRIQVLNTSTKPVKYVEIGWIVRDRQGRQFLAGSVPASDSDLLLPPGQRGRVLQQSSLRFSVGAGEPLAIDGMTGFVSQVEFADGNVWVPSRSSLEASALLSVLAPSPEEQRLTDLYRKRGLQALIAELNKY